MKKKLVWLTGASSGIGEALVYELISRGAKVILTARRADILNEMRNKLKDIGGEVFVYPGDVQNLDQMREISDNVEKNISPIDLLIANAGTHIFTKPEQFNSTEYMGLMELNYGGMLKCIEAVLPSMIKRKQGTIAGMASLAGYRGLPRAAAYGASKAAMIHFLESLRFHLKASNIFVSIINPGFVKTPLTDKNDFYMPFLTNPAQAAKIICNGLEKKKKEISFPFPFNLILKLGRILPYPLYEKIIFKLW